MRKSLSVRIEDWRRDLQAIAARHGQYDADLIIADYKKLLVEADQIIKECEEDFAELDSALRRW